MFTLEKNSTFSRALAAHVCYYSSRYGSLRKWVRNFARSMEFAAISLGYHLSEACNGEYNTFWSLARGVVVSKCPIRGSSRGGSGDSRVGFSHGNRWAYDSSIEVTLLARDREREREITCIHKYVSVSVCLITLVCWHSILHSAERRGIWKCFKIYSTAESERCVLSCARTQIVSFVVYWDIGLKFVLFFFAVIWIRASTVDSGAYKWVLIGRHRWEWWLRMMPAMNVLEHL